MQTITDNLFKILTSPYFRILLGLIFSYFVLFKGVERMLEDHHQELAQKKQNKINKKADKSTKLEKDLLEEFNDYNDGWLNMGRYRCIGIVTSEKTNIECRINYSMIS